MKLMYQIYLNYNVNIIYYHEFLYHTRINEYLTIRYILSKTFLY